MPRPSGETYKPLAPGVYAVFHGRQRVGVRAMVRVRGKLYSHRFGPDTSVTTAKNWQEDTRVEARKAPAPPKAHDGPAGFAADAEYYLKGVAAMTSYRDRERDVQAWVTAFGTQDRATITSAQIAEQLATWRKTLSASTVNHRRTAVLHLWRRLDGKSAANPVRDIPKYHEPEPDARGLSYDVVRAIFDAMPASVHKSRLEVIAYTGLPHASIARLTARDIDLQGGAMVRPERKKGKGTRRQTVPLTSEGIRSLRTLIDQDGLTEPFSRYVMYGEFRRACARVQKATGVDLAGVRPYDLRHSYGTELYRRTGDERAVQRLLGHAKIETTHRYTLGGVDARLRAAVAAFDGSKSPAEGSPRRKTKKKR